MTEEKKELNIIKDSRPKKYVLMVYHYSPNIKLNNKFYKQLGEQCKTTIKIFWKLDLHMESTFENGHHS